MRACRLGFIFLIVLCFIYLLIAQVNAAWSFTIDDMYITLRYAKHWAEGVGLVWNVGEAPVEGYSNFSFLLLGRWAYALNLDPVLVLKGAGVVGLFVLNAVLFQLSRLWMRVRFAVIPCLWLLAYRGQIFWSVSGLETACYEALVVCSVYFMLRGLGFNAYPIGRTTVWRLDYFAWSGFCLAAASMTRPEAPALVLLWWGLVGVYAYREKQAMAWYGFGVMGAVFGMCFLPYFSWRWHYFGRFFPNPVYCKGWIDPLNVQLDLEYLRLVWPFMLCGLGVLKQYRMQGFDFLVWPSVVYLLLCVGADPVVAFANRLFLPAFALCLPVALCGLIQMLNDAWRVYVASAVMLLVFIPMFSLAGYQHFTEQPQSGARMRERVAAWLSMHTSADAHVVLADSGLIPYLSTRHFTDSYCLNNAAMTVASRREMYTRFCQQLWRDKPDIIILTAEIKAGIPQYTPADACLAPQLAHQSIYCKQARFVSTEKSRLTYEYMIYGLSCGVGRR